MHLFYESAIRHFECIVSVNGTMDIAYSKYYSELNGEAKTRYEDKIRLISHKKDPFCHLEVVNSSLHGLQWYEWPEVTVISKCLQLPNQHTELLYTRTA